MKHLMIVAFALVSVIFSGSASAKGGRPAASSSDSGGGNGYRSFSLSLPIVALSREAVARAEYNVGAQASVALEGTIIGQGEDFNDREIEENHGDSLTTKGYEVAVYMTRYTNPEMLAGFYWGLGAGYRRVEAAWSQTPDQNYTLTERDHLNDDGRMNHELRGEGITGHGRVGYRYVAESFPLVVGAYVGVRHWQNKFDDRESESDQYSPTADRDRNNLKYRYMSSFEPGIELGMAF